MAGMFSLGEVKVRPGAYSNIQKVGENSITGAVDGITAVLFTADFGPLNKAVEIDAADGYEEVFGTAGTTDAMAQAMAGGAKKVVAVRIGEGGTVSKVVLKDKDDKDALTITANYPGDKIFSVSVQDVLSDETKRACTIYDGTKEFEQYVFEKGDDEVDALAEAMAASKNFTAAKEAAAGDELKAADQQAFTAGTNPTVTTESYSNGMAELEAYEWNTICVDTEDEAVILALQYYLQRIFEVGKLGMAVVALASSEALEDRIVKGASFNDEKMHFIVNPSLKTLAGDIDGYQTAARIAGMIAACSSNKSLTHTVLSGVTELNEKMTQSQIIEAEKHGGLVLTVSPSKQVWIDSAINTLVTLTADQDEGWKKIRRTKTRYELITRAVTQADQLVGTVDNDDNGRATIVSQIQGVANAMIEEGKLTACKISESKAEGDSCWFDIDAIDKDSAERIYLTFKFRFSTQE